MLDIPASKNKVLFGPVTLPMTTSHQVCGYFCDPTVVLQCSTERRTALTHYHLRLGFPISKSATFRLQMI